MSFPAPGRGAWPPRRFDWNGAYLQPAAVGELVLLSRWPEPGLRNAQGAVVPLPAALDSAAVPVDTTVLAISNRRGLVLVDLVSDSAFRLRQTVVQQLADKLGASVRSAEPVLVTSPWQVPDVQAHFLRQGWPNAWLRVARGGCTMGVNPEWQLVPPFRHVLTPVLDVGLVHGAPALICGTTDEDCQTVLASGVDRLADVVDRIDRTVRVYVWALDQGQWVCPIYHPAFDEL